MLSYYLVDGKSVPLRYYFNCDFIFIFRKEAYCFLKNKKQKSLKRRTVKRITRQARRRF